MLDVRAANVRQLREAGIPEANLHHVADCTRCEADKYHSYRREGKAGGRMISYVGYGDRSRRVACRRTMAAKDAPHLRRGLHRYPSFDAFSSSARLASASASLFCSRRTWETETSSNRRMSSRASRCSGTIDGCLTL